MKEKKLIFISCTGLIILFCLFLTFLALAGAFNRSVERPISYPSNPENIINVELEEKKEFNFAVVTENDTIELRNRLGDKQIITLENKNWKDLKWSTDNQNLTVLGESSEGIYDIFIYNINSKSWSNLTNYKASESGVTSYLWSDSENIYFKQGIGSESWVHNLNINSLSNGVIKVKQKEGELYKISPDKKTLLLKFDSQFNFITLEGEDLSTIIYIKVVTLQGEELNEILKNIYFVDNSDSLIFETLSGKLAEGSRDEISAKEINSGGIEILCQTDENSLVGYKFEDSKLIVNTLSLESFKINGKEVFEDVSAKVLTDKSICYNSDETLIYLESENSKWVVNNKTSLSEVSYLDNVVEVSAKNK